MMTLVLNQINDIAPNHVAHFSDVNTKDLVELIPFIQEGKLQEYNLILMACMLPSKSD